jgi:hypothetical protein
MVTTALDQMTNKQAIITTVQLFANGTIGQYYDLLHRQQQQSEGGGDGGGEMTASVLVWTLNDAQLDKLRMLTVASVARKHVSQQLLSMSGGKGAGEASSSSGGRENGATSPDVEMKMAAVQMGTTMTTTTPPKTNVTRSKTKKKKMNPLAIPYSLLASELHIATASPTTNKTEHMRQLEDVLIQCIYSNIISAKLDQASQSLIIVPSSTLTPTAAGGGNNNDIIATAGQFTTGGGIGTTVGGGGEGVVYGSILSRDLDIHSTTTTTTAPPSPSMMDVTSMLHTLQQFLVTSNTLLDKLSYIQQYNIVRTVTPHNTSVGVGNSGSISSMMDSDEALARRLALDDDDMDGGGGGGMSGDYDMDMMMSSSGGTAAIMGGDGGGSGRRQVKRSKGSGM